MVNSVIDNDSQRRNKGIHDFTTIYMDLSDLHIYVGMDASHTYIQSHPELHTQAIPNYKQVVL